MIERRRDYTKKAPSKEASKIYVICEGKETEPKYFSFFEGLSSNLELMVIPPESGTDPVKLMDLAKEYFLGDSRQRSVDYSQKDEIWFVIDTDMWEQEGKIDTLRKFCESQNKTICAGRKFKPYSAWNIAQSNPCFEIWLYYHHYSSVPVQNDVDRYPSFKAYVGSRISGGFDFEKDQIRLAGAICNSIGNFKRLPDNTLCPYSTEVYFLGDKILPFVKEDLQRLHNKMG